MTAAVELLRRDPPHDPVNRNPFLKMIGLKLEEAAGGKARYTLDLRPELVNVHDAAHGGVIMTVLDAVLASAAVSVHDFTTIVMTIDMSISFMRPGTGRLTMHGRVTGGGATISFCEGEILNEEGEMVAKALGSFKHRKSRQADLT